MDGQDLCRGPQLDRPGHALWPLQARLVRSLRGSEFDGRFHRLGQAVLSLRPGRWSKTLPSVFGARLRAGQAFETTSGVQRRDFIHIDDVGRAIALLARSAATGPVNIASGEAIALRDIALEAAQALGADRALLRFGTMELRAGEPLLLVGDVKRLHGGLGFVPQVAWREGVARFALGLTGPA